jgi:hypothetical protein
MTSTVNTYAVVSSGIVTNVILWDGVSEWAPPEGSTANLLPPSSQVGVGYSYTGTTYTAPVNPAV